MFKKNRVRKEKGNIIKKAFRKYVLYFYHTISNDFHIFKENNSIKN